MRKDEEIKYLKLERAVELYNGDFIHEVKGRTLGKSLAKLLS